MFTLVKVEQININITNRVLTSKLNSLNLSRIVPIKCKSLNQSFLKFMRKLLHNTTCSPVYLKLTIADSKNILYTKTVGRKKLNTPINSFQYVHFIKN